MQTTKDLESVIKTLSTNLALTSSSNSESSATSWEDIYLI